MASSLFSFPRDTCPLGHLVARVAQKSASSSVDYFLSKYRTTLVKRNYESLTHFSPKAPSRLYNDVVALLENEETIAEKKGGGQ